MEWIFHQRCNFILFLIIEDSSQEDEMREDIEESLRLQKAHLATLKESDFDLPLMDQIVEVVQFVGCLIQIEFCRTKLPTKQMQQISRMITKKRSFLSFIKTLKHHLKNCNSKSIPY